MGGNAREQRQGKEVDCAGWGVQEGPANRMRRRSRQQGIRRRNMAGQYGRMQLQDPGSRQRVGRGGGEEPAGGAAEESNRSSGLSSTKDETKQTVAQ